MTPPPHGPSHAVAGVALTKLVTVAQIAASCVRPTLPAVSRYAVTHSFGLPLLSCLITFRTRARTSYALSQGTDYFTDPNLTVGRDGSQLRMGTVHMKEYEHCGVFSVGSVTFGNIDMRTKIRRSKKARKPHAERFPLLQVCTTLTLARCLALQLGTPVDFGWPVLWDEDSAMFFTPRDDSNTDHGLVGRNDEFVSITTCTREEGIHWCIYHWHSLYHVGAVPTSGELPSRGDPDFEHMTLYDLEYDPKLDHIFHLGWLRVYADDDLTYGPDFQPECIVPKPTLCTVMSVTHVPLAPDTPWLMDTGSGVDIISRATIAALSQHITKSSTPMTLLTANGELDATDEIELFVNCIKQNLRMLALPDTPNVISVGRRVVEDGFGFHWDPYSLEPYMTAPETYEHIPMYVENYCPYLRDDPADDHTQGTQHPAMTALTPAAAGEHRVKVDPDVVVVVPPPAPPADVDPGERRDLKAEALAPPTSYATCRTTSIARHAYELR